MKGSDDLNRFPLPNYDFDRAAASAILRRCGVEIGKLDFLAGVPLRRS